MQWKAQAVFPSLAKDKEERYQNAKDLLIDLRKLNHRLEIEEELERSRQSLVSSPATGLKAAQEKMLIDTAKRPIVPANVATSQKAYQYFFALWKNADSSIPIFQEAT
jgi:hypothetical protein